MEALSKEYWCPVGVRTDEFLPAFLFVNSDHLRPLVITSRVQQSLESLPALYHSNRRVFVKRKSTHLTIEK